MSPAQVVFAMVFVCALSWAQELSDEQLQTVMLYHTQCKAETNIDDSVATGVLTGKFPDDPVLKQHMLCMGKKFGVMNDAGEIQKDRVKDYIGRIISDENKVSELAESCAVEKGSPEETAFELTKCVYEGTHP